MGYDANDSVARLLVERIALNAKDAGLGCSRLRWRQRICELVRIPWRRRIRGSRCRRRPSILGMAMPKRSGDTVEDLYSAERELLAGQRMIPLFHFRRSGRVAGAARLGARMQTAVGDLDDSWMKKEQP